MTHPDPDQNSEETRKLKIKLGYDPDDPTITVQWVGEGTPVVGYQPVTATETANENDDPSEERKLEDLILEVLQVMTERDSFRSCIDGAANIHMRSHKLWGQVANDTGSSDAARRLCLEMAADALMYVRDLIDEANEG